MIGAQALGAMPSSLDPTMLMVGFNQTIQLPAAYQAPRARASLDVRWAEEEEFRLEADLRETLWETAARLHADGLEATALDDEVAAAEAALAFGRARYAAGAGTTAPMPRSSSAVPAAAGAGRPVVQRPEAGAVGMGAMTGMGGGQATTGTMTGTGSMPGMGGSTPGMGAMTGMGGAMTGMGAEGLAALLGLQTQVARVQADRAALAATTDGERARLALIVGDDVAGLVAADPSRFVGVPTAPRAQPERTLAATTVRMATADLTIARTARQPTFMVATALRVMPEGMIDGVDAQLGVMFPVWDGAHARIEAEAADVDAASRRADMVGRELDEAIAIARSDEAAAEARATALNTLARPSARAAWSAALAVWGTGSGTTADLVSAWQQDVAVTRDAIAADLAAELARARVARLEGR